MRRMYDENKIKSIASECGGGGKLYIHRVSLKSSLYADDQYYITVLSSDATPITKEASNRLIYGYVEKIDGSDKAYHSCTVKNVVIYDGTDEIEIDGTAPTISFLAAIDSDTVS